MTREIAVSAARLLEAARAGTATPPGGFNNPAGRCRAGALLGRAKRNFKLESHENQITTGCGMLRGIKRSLRPITQSDRHSGHGSIAQRY
jgi:hypothetical protein